MPDSIQSPRYGEPWRFSAEKKAIVDSNGNIRIDEIFVKGALNGIVERGLTLDRIMTCVNASAPLVDPQHEVTKLIKDNQAMEKAIRELVNLPTFSLTANMPVSQGTADLVKRFTA